MEWSEFLNDYELNSSSEYPSPPDGKYLFIKVIHDVLECLNGYKECVRIASTLKGDIPESTLNWLVKWETSVDVWAKEIASLSEYFEKLHNTSPEWPKLIAKVGQILTEVPTWKRETEALIWPSSEKPRLIIQTAIRAITKLGLIWNDIQSREYKRLWTILRYGNLIQ